MVLKFSSFSNNSSSVIILGLALVSLPVFSPSSLAATEFDKNQHNNLESRSNRITSDNSIHGINQTSIIASNPRIVPATINLVKKFEGFRSYAYIDTSGLPVIGYGQTKIHGKTVRMGQYVTQAQADAALEQELNHIQRIVRSHVKVELNPYQLGALTSLVYNAGTRILTHSTLIRKLNAGDYTGAAREFPRWNKANQGGRLVVLPGLTKRRVAEQKLFLTPYNQVVGSR